MDQDLKDFLKFATMIVVFLGLIINEHFQEIVEFVKGYQP